MKPSNLMVRILAPGALVLLLPLALVAACSSPLLGVLADGKDLQRTCPSGRLLASDVRVDASGTFVAADVGGDFEALLRDVSARTAVCGWHLRVSAFSGSSAGTVTLYDDELGLVGATENARFRRLPSVQEHVVDEVSKEYGNFRGLAGGSDIVGQFRLADEYVRQLGEPYVLQEFVVSDGMQNEGIDLSKASDRIQAEAMAWQLAVPDLAGADVVITGLGNRNGAKPSSKTAETLVAFYTSLCSRMNVATCLPSTEYVSKFGR